ncbi:MAG: SHOCT domain-containing protein [Crocinitomicaceae bacterium]|nr:SHOCT domain-containing protein [Crocinitomicaceae bacterium]
MNNRFFSFIGVGFYLTLITSIIGIVVKDKALIETKNTSQKEGQDSITKLSQLKELLEKELISMEEYQQKKEEILKKME